MNRSMIVGLAVGAVAVATGAGIAGYTVSTKSDRTEVVAANHTTSTIRTPHEECRDEQVTHTREPKDKNRIAGSVAGAVVGGIVGNQFGGGKGQGAATAVGVVGGGYAGNQIQERMQQGDTYTTTERVCRTVSDTR